jgi:tRNA(fMet)-specific endonuclease VapC
MGGMIYLLDSNVLSEPSRRHPDPHLMARLKANASASCTAAPVIHEMRYGLARLPAGKRKAELEDYFFRLLRQPIVIQQFSFWQCFTLVPKPELGNQPNRMP